ncbi:uncharacterized protein LOC119287093 [Triticum dicoccoides]|uniref:uncharacterized protein LOC119287093 n=1 Tax=Triticum dicoccoides TaxID=85692 RepID=UPI000E7D171F|nr:uncharacterized protein LOC119287093 [Triticum dicoccoides]
MAAVARSPSPSPSPAAARPCPSMRRSADSNPFKPADCPSQRSASSKGVGGGCGCHHASSPSPRRRSLSSSFGEKENEPRDRTPKPAARTGGPKNFMAPTISAASKAASPRNTSKVLGERNHDTPHLAPFSPANLAHKPKAGGTPDPRRLRLSFDAPLAPAGDDDAGTEIPVRAAAETVGAERSLRHSFEPPPAAAAWHGPLAGDDDDAGLEDPVGVNHPHAAADPVDAEPSRAALYDPKTNYTSPRPRFLHYKPNPRVDIYRHGRAGVGRLEDGFASASASESSDETDATATTEDDLTEEEQEQAQQNHLPREQPALAAPSEAAEACVLAPDPTPGSPRAALLLPSEAAAVTPEPARVSAPEPRATPPRARALTPEPEHGVRAPAKKGSSLRFLLPLAFVLLMSAASVCVLLQPDSPIMSNTALSKASGFLSVQESHPVELAAWLKQWSSSSLDSITSYWEALASTSTQKQEYFGPHFAANWSAAAADGDNHAAAADFYYNFAEAWPVPSEEPISSANALTAEPEEESVDDAGVGEKYDASDYYDMVVVELDVGMPEEAPGSSYGASVLEEQLKIQDAVSEASSADLIAESEGVAAVVEESDADYSKAVDELDVGASEAAPGSISGEEISQDLGTPSQPAEQHEQDVESEEPEDNHGSGKEGQEPHLGLESDSSMSPSYLDRISKPAAAVGVALVVVILSAGVAALSMWKKQAQVATGANVPAEQGQAEEAETRSGSASSEGHRVVKGSVAEETERFGDSGFSQYSSSLSSGHGHGRGKTKEEENVGLEPASKRESMSYSTSSYGSFTTYEKIAAKNRNKDDEAMTPVRRSSRLRSVKSPEAESS